MRLHYPILRRFSTSVVPCMGILPIDSAEGSNDGFHATLIILGLVVIAWFVPAMCMWLFRRRRKQGGYCCQCGACVGEALRCPSCGTRNVYRDLREARFPVVLRRGNA